MESMHMDSRFYQTIASGCIDCLRQFESILFLQLTNGGNTAIHVAVQFEKIECIEEIYNRCPSLLWYMNLKGDTPLHIAARKGQYDIVKFIINLKTPREDVLRGIVEPPELLLRMGNMEKDTALHVALRNHHVGVVKLLIEADPEFSYFPNNAGETPLYLAAEEGLYAIVLLILQTCPFAAHGGPYGRTALHAALIFNHSDITRRLLEKKPGIIKEADDKGRTPFHYAVEYLYWKRGHESVIMLLLDCDSSVAYVSDKDGMTPLHFAAINGAVDVIEDITRRCPDCWELLDNRGWNFLHVAVEKRSIKVVEYVLRTQHKMVEDLLNEPDKYGNTPLHLAVIFEWKRCALLLCGDARVNKRAMNKKNLTAFDIVEEKMPKTDSPDFKHMEEFRSELRKVGAIPSLRKRSIKKEKEKEDEGNEGGFKSAVDKLFIAKVEIKKKEREKVREKVSQTHLVVATLIATVTFAAGFTVPGGYNSEGEDKGMATLTRTAAFRAFVISDTIAMLLSTCAVYIHFWIRVLGDTEEEGSALDFSFLLASYCTLGAIFTMAVAFVTGTYVALGNSLGLAVTTCVIGSSFYLFCLLYTRKLVKIVVSPLLACLGRSSS